MVGHQYLQVVGVACHISSQILDLKPFRQAISEIMQLVHNLERNNVFIQRIDCGGGLGIIMLINRSQKSKS